jgi:Cu(I)/Ag(I) efflux system membrane protein CusA/SilA
MEAQVTYPIVTAMLGAPRVKAVRGVSDFGYSYVYVIFEEGTDIYWARTRTMEYLSGVLSAAALRWRTDLGPDASRSRLGVSSTRSSTARARTASPICGRTRTGTLRSYLKAVPGVSEVASLGGFGKASTR